MDRLHDRDREVEFGSLHRINDELAEFARPFFPARFICRPSMGYTARPEGRGAGRATGFRFQPLHCRSCATTTALRWITAMTESGMLLRRQDPSDA